MGSPDRQQGGQLFPAGRGYGDGDRPDAGLGIHRPTKWGSYRLRFGQGEGCALTATQLLARPESKIQNAAGGVYAVAPSGYWTAAHWLC